MRVISVKCVCVCGGGGGGGGGNTPVFVNEITCVDIIIHRLIHD